MHVEALSRVVYMARYKKDNYGSSCGDWESLFNLAGEGVGVPEEHTASWDSHGW